MHSFWDTRICMDGKKSRYDKNGTYWRKVKWLKAYGRSIWKAAQLHRKGIVTGFLLLVLTALLLGIASQLSAPALSETPHGATPVAYSDFMGQVRVGNVLAVVIEGNDVQGFLAVPLNQNAAASQTPVSGKASLQSPEYLAWSRELGLGNPATTGIVPDPDYALYTQLPPGGSAAMIAALDAQHVEVHTLPATGQITGWVTLLGRIVPIILLGVFLLFFLLISRQRRNAMWRDMDPYFKDVDKNRVRRGRPGIGSGRELRKGPTGAKGAPTGRAVPVPIVIPSVTFADVAGINEVREELAEIVQFLRDPGRYERLGAHIPRGALLVGPPGTGKTLLAKAVAGEADVPFFNMSASEFVEMFVGVGASRVRDLFRQAREAAPCVVFIDELDAVGRKRAQRMVGNDERDQTLNQLLIELDGFNARHAVVVLAATNRVDILDKALLRPGRFDRRISVSPPDRVGREAILRVHTRNTPLAEDVELERLARLTTGMTGADLANLVNEAALVAARRDLDVVDHECFEQALARVQLGALRPLVMSEEERRTIAFHEGGHALVAYHLPEADTVNRVTILPRGQSLGVTQFSAEIDRYNYSRSVLMARIAVGLGGRVAEELIFGAEQVTTGAENDLQIVTELARSMVTRWGMSRQVGVMCADPRATGDYALTMQRVDPALLAPQSQSLAIDADGNVRLNSRLASQHHQQAMPAPVARNQNGIALSMLIDAEIQSLLHEGYSIAHEILSSHKEQLTLLADALMLHEQLDRGQFEALLRA